MATNDVVPYTPGAVSWVAPTPETARAAMRLYQEISAAIITTDDLQPIGKKSFPKRSAFQKLGHAYRVSCEIIKDHSDYDADGKLIRVAITVRATHPDGRVQDGDGRCHIAEKGRAADDPKSEHDVHGTAVTRAKNRAIGDLIAFGAVSAEEAGEDVVGPPAHPYGPPASPKDEERLLAALFDLGVGPAPANQIEAKFGYMPRVSAWAVMAVAAALRDMPKDGEVVESAPKADTPADTEAE